MPRSGSTLVEQMIAAHNEVSGAGELSYVDTVAKNFLEELRFNKQKIIEEASAERNILAEQYIELLKYHKFETNIITDKAPQNFLWLGFIKIFFPNSKIICIVLEIQKIIASQYLKIIFLPTICCGLLTNQI